MQWLFRGFEQTSAGREYKFETLVIGKEPLRATVVIDLQLMREHGIHLQDGVTLCLRRLAATEPAMEAEPASTLRIVLSDHDMISFLNQQQLLRERRGRNGI
jgi:hypothetical protein